MKTLNLAVIGKDVSKSLSPEMHAFIAEKTGNKVDYRKISVPEEEFEGSIESLISGLDGFISASAGFVLVQINRIMRIISEIMNRCFFVNLFFIRKFLFSFI